MSTVIMESNSDNGLGELPQVELPYRSPSIRREPKLSGNNLRHLYQSSDIHSETQVHGHLEVTLDNATPLLPPTPPHIDGEGQDEDPSSSDTTKMRSVLVTPVNQLSPPTPDITPPRHQHSRHLLGARPSMASTYAESFKTAQEDIVSDTGSTLSLPIPRRVPFNRSSPLLPISHGNEHKPSPLTQMSCAEVETRQPEVRNDGQQVADVRAARNEPMQLLQDSPVVPQDMFPRVALAERIPSPPIETFPKPGVRRGLSLKERLEESQHLPRSRSLDKFANIIGWNDGVQVEDTKRWSGISTASTVEAIVIDQPQVAKRRGTLRHMSKNNSLRLTSSPLPPSYQYTSIEITHRLNHKKAKLSDRHRQSFSSDRSRSLSFGHGAAAPKIEVIRVAVIPERMSSLQPSTTSTRRHSHSTSTTSAPLHVARGVESGVQSARGSTEAADRGRDRYYPPQVGPFTVPLRSSSLSATTSRTTSRANSITSESIRSARKQAENELRNTLSRMETDRLVSSLQNVTPTSVLAAPKQPAITTHDFASGVEGDPGCIMAKTPEHSAPVRPLSAKMTLYSAPSFLSASPEINEARLISFVPHNNHSIQLIEPFPQPESNAVQSMRQQYSGRNHADSPFRDPRAAPVPPQTTSSQLGHVANRSSTAPPPRMDSFARTLMHSVSLKHARNRKTEQNLDAASHPMWRPRPFWDDADARKRRAEEHDQSRQEGELVQNSVGIPQTRTTFMGPVALMHRISNRRRARKAVVKQSSFTSLHRLRTGRRLYRIPGLGVHLQMMSIRDIQSRITRGRLRREEEKREQRRQELKDAIGTNVISTGDSRFPTDIV